MSDEEQRSLELVPAPEPELGMDIPDWREEQIPEGWGLELLEQADRDDDLARIRVGHNTLGMLVHDYRARASEVKELRIGERMCEIRMGELLGPRPGRGGDRVSEDYQSVATDSSGLSKDEVYEFRKLAYYRQDVLTWIKGGTIGRQALLQLIKALEAGERESPLDGLPLCAVLYADPPWRRDHNVTSRAAENHYTTMATEDIAALAPPAADDAVLFLWAVPPMLPEALGVLSAWGFEYKANMVWVKDRVGLGWYVRYRHEHLLVGVRGDLPTPGPADRPMTVVTAPRGEHSAKPEVFYDIIERMYGRLPKLELFARAAREGWHQWGHGVAGETVEEEQDRIEAAVAAAEADPFRSPLFYEMARAERDD